MVGQMNNCMSIDFILNVLKNILFEFNATLIKF